MKKTLTLLTIAGTLVSGVSFAQEQTDEITASNKLNSWSIGAHAGMAYLMPSKLIRSDADKLSDAWGFNGDHTGFDLAYGLYVEKQLSPFIGLQLGADLGKMRGQTADRVNPNTSAILKGEYVEMSFTDIQLRGTFNFSNLTKKRESNKVGFYGIVTTGVVMSDVTRGFVRDLDDNVPNASIRQIDGNNTFKLGAGLGLRYHFSSNFRMELESVVNSAFEGDFDGDVLLGYGDKRDAYNTTTLGLAYTFGKGKSMHEVSVYSKENFWNNGIVEDNSQVDEDRIKGIVNTEIADEMEDIIATKKKLAELEKQLADQKKLIKELHNNDKKEATPTVVSQVFQVFYATGSDKITNDYQKEITVLGELMRDNPGLKATITGYTDKRGSEKRNADLRLKRAEGVKAFLVNMGIDASRLSTTASTQNIIGDGVDHLNRKSTIKFN
jgi:OOP family OmpA-OmpF porin